MFVMSDYEWGNSFLFFFVVVNRICLELVKVLGCKMIWRTSSEMWDILMQFILQDYCTERPMLNIIVWCLLFFLSIFRLVLFWTGCVADDGLGTLTYFYTLWGVFGCDTVTLWDGEGGNIGDTDTLLFCTRRETGVIVGVGVKTVRTIVGVLVAIPRNYYFLQVRFWLCRHIPVMVQLMVCFEGWQEFLFLTF